MASKRPIRTAQHHHRLGWSSGGAAVLLVNEQREVLLVQENYGFRRWSLPGGSIEHGETPEVAATREAYEETSLRVRVNGRLGIYTVVHEGGDFPVVVFFATVASGHPKVPTTGEISDVRWFNLNENLPEPASNILPAVLKDLQTHQSDVNRRVPNRYI